jgi:4'-phosphopantetheinyl transferase
MELLIADAREWEDEKLFARGMEWIPRERREQISRYKHVSDKRRGLAAGLLLEYGLREYGLSLIDATHFRKVTTVTDGKPKLAGGEIFFNLSHSGDYAAAVFSSEEVGVDLELIRSASDPLLRRVLSDEEQQLFKLQNTDLNFTRIWTRKESYSKAIGKGIHLPFSSFSVADDLVTSDDTDDVYRLATYEEPEGYVISVCRRGTEAFLCRPRRILLQEIV